MRSNGNIASADQLILGGLVLAVPTRDSGESGMYTSGRIAHRYKSDI
jgi:hypothetical protein